MTEKEQYDHDLLEFRELYSRSSYIGRSKCKARMTNLSKEAGHGHNQTNNERFNQILNQCKYPRRVYTVLMANGKTT